jgi:hypothetical protein
MQPLNAVPAIKIDRQRERSCIAHCSGLLVAACGAHHQHPVAILTIYCSNQAKSDIARTNDQQLDSS